MSSKIKPAALCMTYQLGRVFSVAGGRVLVRILPPNIQTGTMNLHTEHEIQKPLPPPLTQLEL